MFGKLHIIGKNGSSELEFPLEKKSILIGRQVKHAVEKPDQTCDIRIVNKEISRKHAELYVEDSGTVFINSMGREPISVNGTPILSPLELKAGDKIEVHLEGRTRAFYYYGPGDKAEVPSRSPLSLVNATVNSPHTAAKPIKSPSDDKKGRENEELPLGPPSDSNEKKEELVMVKQGQEDKHVDDMVVDVNVDTIEEQQVADVEMHQATRDTSCTSRIVASLVEKAISAALNNTNYSEPAPATETIATDNIVAQLIEQAVAAAIEGTSNEIPEPAQKIVASMVETAIATALEGESTEAFPETTQKIVANMVEQAIAAAVQSTAEGCDPTHVIVTSMVEQAIAVALAKECVEEMPMPTQKIVASMVEQAIAAAVRTNTAKEQKCVSNGASPQPSEPTSKFVGRLVQQAIAAAMQQQHEAGIATTSAATALSSPVLAPAVSEHTHKIVSDMVAQAIAAAVASANAATPAKEVPDSEQLASEPTGVLVANMVAQAIAAARPTPFTAQKTRKSVRFDASTPEGAPLEATMTLRCRHSLGEQAVLVEDDTIAFKEWALGSMNDHHGDAAELPDTVASKKSRRESVMTANNAPSSAARRTPTSCGMALFAEGVTPVTMGSMPLVGGKGTTPARGGVRAPASTPLTAVKMADNNAASAVVDVNSLAARLAELAEEHDITFELPADFMRFTPMTIGAKKSISVIVTPRTGGVKSAAMSAPRTAGRSRLGQVIADEPAATEEVMQPWTNKSTACDLGEVVDQVTAVLEAAASARKSVNGNRRSLSRTPGAKIAILGGNVNDAPCSATVPASIAVLSSIKNNKYLSLDGKSQEQLDTVPLDQDMVEQAMMNATSEDDKPQGAASLQQQKPRENFSGVPSTVGICSDEDNRHEQRCNDDSGESNEGDELDSVQQEERPMIAPAPATDGSVPKLQYTRLLLKAKSYRAQVLQLTGQARSATARSLRLKRVATALGAALQLERARRLELQDALKQIVANREEEEADMECAINENSEMMPDADDGAMDTDAAENNASAQAIIAPKVIVVGYKPAPVPQCTEMAGCVVVVRPPRRTTAVSPVTATPGPASFNRTAKTPISIKKTPKTVHRSVRRTPALVGKAGDVVVDDVQVPGWVFEEEGKESSVQAVINVEAELAEVEREEAKEAAAMKKLEGEVANVDVEDELDDDMEDGVDVCHVCSAGEEGDVLLLCDGCENACHLSCCDPPLKRVPKGDWHCKECFAKKAKEEEEAAGKKSKRKPVAGRGVAKEQSNKAVESQKSGRGRKAAVSAGGAKRGRLAQKEIEESAAPAKKKTRGAAKDAPTKRGGRR